MWDRWQNLHEDEVALSANLADLGNLSLESYSLEGLKTAQLDRMGIAIAEFLDNLASALERYADALTETLTSGDLNRAGSEFHSAQALLEQRKKRFKKASARAARLKQLADASTRARVDVTAERFAALEPLVGDIYSRLDPHPAFKMIGFQHSTYRGKGTSTPVVSDMTVGVDADPLVVFSASQANIAALSYFLAMSLGAGERGLPFVLLDDPLQSMDDVNVLGFADLCRFVRSRRQLVVSTHDRRFSNLLRRKLSPRRRQDRTVIHEFRGWDRRGPMVETEILEYRERDAQLCLLTKG